MDESINVGNLPTIDLTGVALVVSALGTLVTAAGIAIVGIMTARQNKTLIQVEKQGNSVALEQKRVTSVALRLLAEKTGLPEDVSKAVDSEKVYAEALKHMQQ